MLAMRLSAAATTPLPTACAVLSYTPSFDAVTLLTLGDRAVETVTTAELTQHIEASPKQRMRRSTAVALSPPHPALLQCSPAHCTAHLPADCCRREPYNRDQQEQRCSAQG